MIYLQNIQEKYYKLNTA